MTTHNDPIYSTGAWARARLAAHARDGYRCTRCSATGRLDVHHITPLARGGAPFDLSNLQTLCAACHARVETWTRVLMHQRARGPVQPLTPARRFTRPTATSGIDVEALVRALRRPAP